MRIGGEAPGGGPILSVGISAMFVLRFPPPRILNSAVREKPARAPNGAEWSPRSGKPFQPAGRKTTPSSVSPVVTKRQSAMSSLRASATIIVLRVPARLSTVRAWYPPGQCALLLKPQKAPGELDHATADPGVAGSGESLFSPLRATLVRRACQASVARHCFSVTHWPREHLIDQHVCRFNADADDPSQVPYHGVWPGLGLLL